jgi:flagellin FlaB
MIRDHRNQDAFTGLEAAIVFVAFVVVAAVFSYVILGSGFFTTQKSQQAITSAIGQASANMVVSGSVIGHATSPGELNDITFFLQLSAGDTPVDMGKVIYTLSTPDRLVTYSSTDPHVHRTQVKAEGTPDDLLEKLELDKVVITVPELSIGANTRFSIEIKPDRGSPLLLDRRAPELIAADGWYDLS